MAKFEIIGRRPLSGEIEVYGAKNAALKMIAAALVIDGETVLENVPEILDVKTMLQIISSLSVKSNLENHRLRIDTHHLKEAALDEKLIGSIRASVILVGALLSRFKKLTIPHPGGDKIGPRPIDRHLDAFRQLGIVVKEEGSRYKFYFEQLKNNVVNFKQITVTGTENIILFAAGLSKPIRICNCAIEPEIIDLIEMLRKAGVKISIQARTITVEGKPSLRNVTHQVIPDRLEVGTFACLAAAASSEMRITNCRTDILKRFLEVLAEIGVKFEKGNNYLYIKKSAALKSHDIVTGEYPDLSTDLHPPLGVLLTQARGTSLLNERVHEGRLGYLDGLKKMGANIEIVDKHRAKIIGPTNLSGTTFESLDIRAGATMIIAGLIAQGKTVINQAEIIDRGYERIEERLSDIGADIKRIP